MAFEKQVGGYDVWLDPSAITVEIVKGHGQETLVRIFLQNESEPREHKFATKEQALDFYTAAWKLRYDVLPPTCGTH